MWITTPQDSTLQMLAPIRREKSHGYQPEGDVMKYSNLDLGTIEAVFNKLGGIAAAQAFLRDEVTVTKPAKPNLLRFMSTESVAAVPSFKSADNFKVDTKKAAVRIYYLGDNFKKHFGRKEEGASEAVEIKIHKLLEGSLDAPIITELADKCEITLGQFFALLSKQGKGGVGPLLTNGYANIAYIRDDEGILWAVYAFWFSGHGGWQVEAYSVEHPVRWYAGYQVLSR